MYENCDILESLVGSLESYFISNTVSVTVTQIQKILYFSILWPVSHLSFDLLKLSFQKINFSFQMFDLEVSALQRKYIVNFRYILVEIQNVFKISVK